MMQCCQSSQTQTLKRARVLVLTVSRSAFDATNEVLVGAGRDAVTVDEYKVGCKYTTPERFNYHLGLQTGDAEGARLGQIFDDTYVARVSPMTAGLFTGIDGLVRALAMNGHPQGVLSNAYVAALRYQLLSLSLSWPIITPVTTKT